ncbi:MAG TPA: hypothetical protein PLJ44_11705, partial [Victivallales bacterium]|nr:hypothetical protein [Victivallales bacterium]
MKTKKNALLPKISFFLSFLFFIFLFTAHTQESKKTNEARQLWLKGFEIYEKAELDEKLGKYSEALQGYEKAITFFKTVRSNYPDWNTYLIDFRIKKCSEQITNLRNLLKKTEEKRTVIDEKVPSALDVKIYEARIKDLQEELLSTRQQLEKALSGISAAKKEAAQGAAALEELRRLNQEKIELEKRYQLLSEQLDKALKKEESSKSLDKDTELNALKNKLKEYVDKLNAIEGKIKEYEEQTQILKKENQTLKMAKTEFDFKEKEYENKIKTTEKRLEDTLKNLDLLREKITKQEEIVEELKKENGKLNSKLAEQKKENDELTDKLSKALDKSQSDSLLKKLQEENTNLLKNIEDNKLKIDNFAKIAEEQHKIAAELAVKNEKLEKILADYVKKDETSTTELIALKKKLSELSELSASQEKDIATLTKEKLAYEDTIQKLSQKVNQLTKKDDDYT